MTTTGDTLIRAGFTLGQTILASVASRDTDLPAIRISTGPKIPVVRRTAKIRSQRG